MFKSFRIGQLFNIPIFIHWSFLLLPLIVIYRSDALETVNIVWELALVFALFGCVLLHEFGHALSARRYGVKTLDIILSIIGGVARLTRLPEKPWQELVVAAAGPAVNVVITAVIGFLLWITGNFDLPYAGVIDSSNFLPILAFANIALAVFNLVPAFPMDGGRILRAGLAMKLSRLRATFIAMVVGQVLATGFAAYGIYSGNYTLIFIAVFVFYGAATEYRGIKKETALSNHKVRDTMEQQFCILQQSHAMNYAIQMLTNTGQQHFVVLNLMSLEGVLTHQNILKSIHEKDTLSPISKYMTKDFVALSADDNIKNAYHLFQNNNYEIIPIIENGVVIGILDKTSLNEFLITQEAK
jgi:Zn-dependent protease/predicted transcriptional regulator